MTIIVLHGGPNLIFCHGPKIPGGAPGSSSVLKHQGLISLDNMEDD